MLIREKIEELKLTLTMSEHKVASTLLVDYPFAGLEPIQELAKRAGVSPPSITRFVNKIGCHGFQEFQRQLISELKEGYRSPVELKLTESPPAKPTRFLADYAGRVAALVQFLAKGLSQQQFDAVCGLIADPGRNVFLLGGRVSDSLAALLTVHLRQIRSRIHHLPNNPELWPEYLLRMRKKDVVILFDFRRYQASLAELAGMIAGKRRPTIVAITDKWLSPVTRHCKHVLVVPTETGTAWDGQVGAVALIEAMIVKIAEQDWDATRRRIGQWDAVRLTPPIGDTANLDGERERPGTKSPGKFIPGTLTRSKNR